MTTQPGPAYALNEVGRNDNGDGTVSLNFRWNMPSTIGQSDQVFFDISPDPGFVSYSSQVALVKTTTAQTARLTPGIYYVRINIHYPGYVIAGVDRGWLPSNVVPAIVPGGPPPPTGVPATNLHIAANKVSWSQGQGVDGSVITLIAFDMSITSGFADILQAPFIDPHAGAVTFDKLPFSVNVPQNLTQLTVNGIPPMLDYYMRINTLFSGRTWLSSEVIHIAAGKAVGLNPLLIAGAIGAGIIGVALYEKNNGKGSVEGLFRG